MPHRPTPTLASPSGACSRPAKVAFWGGRNGSNTPLISRLRARYGEVERSAADVIVVVGGNGKMLEALHLGHTALLFGLSLGEASFLNNRYSDDSLLARIANAEPALVSPLQMVCCDRAGNIHQALAFNEVAAFRQTRRMSTVTVKVNGKVQIDRLLGDGLLIATPLGSTAYNRSARGPILPLDSRALAVTPLSPARPPWAGAILPEQDQLHVQVLAPRQRPVAATADFTEIRDVVSIAVRLWPQRSQTLLFDHGSGLHERQLIEQFQI